MKSVSPWTKTQRFLNVMDTFPISKCLSPAGTLRRVCFSVSVPNELTVVPIMVLFASLSVEI